MRFASLALVSLSIALSTSAFAESSVRIRCADAVAEGASIYLNGKHKGSCPLNLFLEAGTYKISAVKAINDTQERTFETTLKLGQDVDERVTVELGQPVLNATAAKAALNVHIAKLHTDANAGNIAALEELIKRYNTGDGVTKNTKKAAELSKALATAKAEAAKQAEVAETSRLLALAKQSNAKAISALIPRYRNGVGTPVNEEHAQIWEKELARLNSEATKKQQADSLDFLALTGAMSESFDDEMTFTFSPTILSAMAIDAVLSPVTTSWKIAAHQGWLSATTRPALWGNPNSLMARAEARRQNTFAK